MSIKVFLLYQQSFEIDMLNFRLDYFMYSMEVVKGKGNILVSLEEENIQNVYHIYKESV